MKLWFSPHKKTPTSLLGNHVYEVKKDRQTKPSREGPSRQGGDLDPENVPQMPRHVRFHADVPLPEGETQLGPPTSAKTLWFVRRLRLRPPVAISQDEAPQTGASLSPSPFPRHGHALPATATSFGELFLFGGQAADTVRNDLYVFSLPELGTALLHTRGTVPGPRIGHAVARVNSVFIVWGGDTRLEGRGKQDDGLYMLNLQTRTWTKPHMDGLKPVGRFGHTIATMGSKLFVFGGQVDSDFFNDLWMFDFDTLRTKPVWARVEIARGSPKPARRKGHVCIVHEEQLIIFGGTDGHNHFNDTWAFDVRSSQWTKLVCTGFVPAPREGHSAVIVDGVVYVFGGRGIEGMELDDLAMFQISSRHWFIYRHLGVRPSPRWGHAMSKFGTNVLIFGGASHEGHIQDENVVHVLNTKIFKLS